MKDHTEKVTLDELMPLILERIQAGQSVRFYPRGSSMLPMLRPGTDSVVLSAPPSRLKKYDLPLYQRKNGRYVLHRVVKAKESYTCIGDNQFAYESGLEHPQVLAVVTAFYRGDRKYTAEDPRYWFYCRFWHHSRRMRWFLRRVGRGLGRRIKAVKRIVQDKEE